MKQIDVYLQYPWKFPDSPYYKYLLEAPPEKIKFINVEKDEGVTTKIKKFRILKFVKNYGRKIIKILKVSLPNVKISPKGDYDLIHCAHCVSKNNFPWICDIEMINSFFLSGELSKKGIEKVKKILIKNNCKKILPWMEWVKKDIIKTFPEIKEKVEVVYPAVPFSNIKPKKFGEKITLLFSGRYFFGKGGFHALEIMDKITKKNKNISGIIISDIPPEIHKKYSKNKKLILKNLVSQKELFKIYKKADIFLYPGYWDSFGFAFLEAMNYGLPIVTANILGRKEIISKKEGLVLELPKNFDRNNDCEKLVPEVITLFEEKINNLIKNKSQLKKMSENGLNKIKSGRFSIKERNKKLRRIYEEATK